MNKLKWVITGIISYIVLYYLLHFVPFLNLLPWQVVNLLDALLIFILIFIKISGKLGVKIFLAILAVILGFISSIVSLNVAHFYAEDLCAPLIKTLPCTKNPDTAALTTYNCKENVMESNGNFKYWNIKEECELKLMPFPWGKTPSL